MSAQTVGVHAGVAMNSYLAMQAFSAGMVHRLLSSSPLHCWLDSVFNPGREDDSSKVSDIGTYAHACLLEGGTDKLCVIDAPDWRTKAAKEARDFARLAGQLPILAHKQGDVGAMVHAAQEYVERSEFANLFASGAPEQTIIFDIEGTLCKARPDWLSPGMGVMLHYKTSAGSVNPSTFERVCDSMGYDSTMAFYARAADSFTDADSIEHYILAQEQTAPYACKLFSLSAAKWAIAHNKVTRAIGIWQACVKANRFPAYDGSVYYIEPTSWQLAQEEQAQIIGLGHQSDISNEGVQA